MAVVKTADLAGATLDWAVAKCEGLKTATYPGRGQPPGQQECWINVGPTGHDLYDPSTNWHLAGQIIRRENIGLSPPTSRVHRYGGPHAGWGPSNYWSATTWHADVNGRRSIGWHETEPLVAAMRCYVASKLGEEVDVPDELMPAPKEAP